MENGNQSNINLQVFESSILSTNHLHDHHHENQEKKENNNDINGEDTKKLSNHVQFPAIQQQTTRFSLKREHDKKKKKKKKKQQQQHSVHNKEEGDEDSRYDHQLDEGYLSVPERMHQMALEEAYGKTSKHRQRDIKLKKSQK